MTSPAPANPNVVLVPATAAQLRISHKRQLVEWGRGLTIEQFAAREEHLIESTGFGKTEQTWVLAPADDTETLDFYASCETWRRPILLSLPSAPSTVTRSIAYSIGSVFCPPQHRRRGYAQRMMTLLHDKLALPSSATLSSDHKFEATIDKPHVPNDAALSFLFSDVGEFYSRCGETPWIIQGSERTTVWTLAGLRSLPVQDESMAEPISPALFSAIALVDAAQIKVDLALEKSSIARFAVEPTEGVYDWLLARAEFAYSAQELELPDIWGFSLPLEAGSEQKCPSFVVFTIDPSRKISPGTFSPGTLKIVRLRANTPSHGAELLLRALEFAQQRKEVDLVVGWNLPQSALDLLKETEQALEGKTGPREDSLSAVACYGPLAGGEKGNLVEWSLCEGYSWC